MKKHTAISLPESILAICICFMAFFVFMSVFSSASRATIQSRDRTAAILLANSLMDEFEAHSYGSPRPKSWNEMLERPVRVWVEGRLTEMNFHKQVKFKNGSFVGESGGNEEEDECFITISWREASGHKQTPVVDPNDNKVLVARYPVWR
ncbi:hypothetical protein IV102_06005 [bacterium]|nr:hypothetical protein [bacterium]